MNYWFMTLETMSEETVAPQDPFGGSCKFWSYQTDVEVSVSKVMNKVYTSAQMQTWI